MNFDLDSKTKIDKLPVKYGFKINIHIEIWVIIKLLLKNSII